MKATGLSEKEVYLEKSAESAGINMQQFGQKITEIDAMLPTKDMLEKQEKELITRANTAKRWLKEFLKIITVVSNVDFWQRWKKKKMGVGNGIVTLLIRAMENLILREQLC